MPTGTYQVIVQAYDPFTGEPTPAQDLLKGEFLYGISKLTTEVSSASPEVIIDVSKK